MTVSYSLKDTWILKSSLVREETWGKAGKYLSLGKLQFLLKTGPVFQQYIQGLQTFKGWQWARLGLCAVFSDLILEKGAVQWKLLKVLSTISATFEYTCLCHSAPTMEAQATIFSTLSVATAPPLLLRTSLSGLHFCAVHTLPETEI